LSSETLGGRASTSPRSQIVPSDAGTTERRRHCRRFGGRCRRCRTGRLGFRWFRTLGGFDSCSCRCGSCRGGCWCLSRRVRRW
jgi:hypothetical protein